MYILHIEHSVPSYEGWKEAFDSDPVGRGNMGVRRHQISRPTDNPNYVMINLEFNAENEAEALLAALKVVWGRVEGTIKIYAHAHLPSRVVPNLLARRAIRPDAPSATGAAISIGRCR